MKEKLSRAKRLFAVILSNSAAAQAASATAQNSKRVMRAYAQQTTRPLSTMMAGNFTAL